MRLLWCSLVVLLWAGCDALTFSPSDETPFTEVDPTQGTLTIELTTSEDTLALWGDATLTYDLETLGSGPVDSVRVQLGDQISTPRPGQPFSFQTTDLPDGLYPLRLTAYATSGTRSIADVYGRETVTTEVVRVAAIDNAPPQTVPIQALDAGDELLTVRWQRYPRFNFEAYRISWENPAGGAQRLVATISDRNITSWSDLRFVGGDVRYYIDVVAGDGRRSDASYREGSYPVPEILSAEIGPGGQAEVRWSGTRFPGALDRYEVIDPGSSVNVDALYATTQDTTASFSVTSGDPPPFGALYEIAVQTWGRPESDGRSNSSTRLRSEAVEVSLDPESGFFRKVFSVPDQNAVYGLDATTRQPVIRDAGTLDIRAQASLPANAFAWYALASPSGRLAVVYSRSGLYYSALLNPTTLAVEQEVALEPFIGAGAVPDVGEFGFPALTDDGVLFYAANPNSSDYAGPTVVGVDLVAGERVAAFGDGVGPLAVLDVSEDGSYIMLGAGAQEQLHQRNDTDPSGYQPIRGLEQAIGGLPRDGAFVGPSQIAILGSVS